jgi:hypothetical protein
VLHKHTKRKEGEREREKVFFSPFLLLCSVLSSDDMLFGVKRNASMA